ILYNLLFLSVMIRLDALTGDISKSLLYVVVVFSYLSYCWTSLVLTNVIYTLVACVSAAHYLPSKAYEGSVLQILNRVTWTKSLGSICYGSSTPLGPISQLFRTSWKEIKSSAYKYALYNVAVYGMDYDSAADDIRTRMAELQVSDLLEHFVVTQLLFCNAVCCDEFTVPIYDPLTSGAPSTDDPVPPPYSSSPPQRLFAPVSIDTSILSSAPISDPETALPAYQKPAPVSDHTSYKNK
ncbi:hypothetical protein BGZ81_002437, partial [Podila clonocystis]